MAGNKAHSELAQKLKIPVRTRTAFKVESCVAYVMPSRIAGKIRREGAFDGRSPRFHCKSTKITPKNEIAFIRNTQPGFAAAAMINPPSAGPTALATLKAAAFNATAAGKQ